MLYLVVKYDHVTGRREVMAEITDAAKAYDLAHELDAAAHFGRDEIFKYDKSPHPCSITIEDEDGNDVWQECMRARCPSTGMFQ